MPTVKSTIDPKKPPKASQETLDFIDNLADEDIDYSDIPEFSDEFLANAEVVESPLKRVVSLRLERDVIDYFKADNPKKYTSRMAAVLSAYVKTQQRREP